MNAHLLPKNKDEKSQEVWFHCGEGINQFRLFGKSPAVFFFFFKTKTHLIQENEMCND